MSSFDIPSVETQSVNLTKENLYDIKYISMPILNLNPSKRLNCMCKSGEIKGSPSIKTCHWYQGAQAGKNVLSSHCHV